MKIRKFPELWLFVGLFVRARGLVRLYSGTPNADMSRTYRKSVLIYEVS